MLVFMSQLILLIGYLLVNIINVGQPGSHLYLLLSYVVISTLVFASRTLKSRMYISFWFLPYLMFLFWFISRVLIDLNDLEYLKQVTIATSGGIVMFLTIGLLFHNSLSVILSKICNTGLFKDFSKMTFLLLMVVLCVNIYTIYSFVPKMRSDIFIISDLLGYFQRAGYFATIVFIINSYILYLNTCIVRIHGSAKASQKSSMYFYLYTFFFLSMVIPTQMYGSNNATVTMTGIYFITIVLSKVINAKKWLIRRSISWQLLNKIVTYGFVSVTSFILILGLFIYITKFDILSLRLLGFGSGILSSLVERHKILVEYYWIQFNYSPIVGNMNVDVIASGREGAYAHSFLLYILSHLGIFGFLLAFFMFALVFWKLYKISRSGSHHIEAVSAIYAIFVLLYLFLVANLAVSITWPVIWFALGLFAKPVYFK